MFWKKILMLDTQRFLVTNFILYTYYYTIFYVILELSYLMIPNTYNSFFFGQQYRNLFTILCIIHLWQSQNM